MILVILCGQISQNSALIVPSMCVAHARVTEHLTKYSPFHRLRYRTVFGILSFEPNVVYFKGDNMLKDGQMIDFSRPFNKKEQIFQIGPPVDFKSKKLSRFNSGHECMSNFRTR